MSERPSPMEIRQARETDAEGWLRLRLLLWPDADPVQEREQVDAFFGPGNVTVAAVFLAVDDDGRSVGFAEISLRPYVPGASTFPAPFLEGWFVEPPLRGTGIGRRLIEAAERWAVDRGYRELGSDTDLEDAAAASAHGSVGFHEVEKVRFFIKSLGGA